MRRRNIFEILNEKMSINDQVNKIEKLLLEYSVEDCKPEYFVDKKCMRNWKARDRFVSCEEIRERLCITHKSILRGLSGEQVLSYLEYVSNIIWLCNEKYWGVITSLMIYMCICRNALQSF